MTAEENIPQVEQTEQPEKKQKKPSKTFIITIIVLLLLALLAFIIVMLWKPQEPIMTQIVRYMNQGLAEESSHPTMQSALDNAKAHGYDVRLINLSRTDYEIMWDSQNDCFIYFNSDTNKLVYVPDTVEKKDQLPKNDMRIWKIYNSAAEIPEKQTYSIYAGGKDWTRVPALTVGFDAGKNMKIASVNYVGTGSAQVVTIRTNSFATLLSVNAAKDTVNHYGPSCEVSVTAAKYLENGLIGRMAAKNADITLAVDAKVIAGTPTGECGYGNHTHTKLVTDTDNAYEVCEACGYTVVNVLTEDGNLLKKTADGCAVTALDIVDENGQTLITTDPKITAESCGHIFGEPTVEVPTEKAMGSLTFVCDKCGKKVVVWFSKLN